MNAVEIEQAITDLAEQPFDAANFPYAFLEAFGNKATTIERLEKLFDLYTRMTAAAGPAKAKKRRGASA